MPGTYRTTSGCTENVGLDVLSTKAVLRKHRNVRDARTERLNANTAFKRERAVFILVPQPHVRPRALLTII